jgi:hypothetical protein
MFYVRDTTHKARDCAGIQQQKRAASLAEEERNKKEKHYV